MFGFFKPRPTYKQRCFIADGYKLRDLDFENTQLKTRTDQLERIKKAADEFLRDLMVRHNIEDSDGFTCPFTKALYDVIIETDMENFGFKKKHD